MTDRGLLELAAKAAGIQIVGEPDHRAGGYVIRNDRGGDSCWNPLTDDGDALRLAVRLRMHVNVYPTRTSVTADGVYLEQLHDMDHMAATRRAITRAAAEIGKEMK